MQVIENECCDVWYKLIIMEIIHNHKKGKMKKILTVISICVLSFFSCKEEIPQLEDATPEFLLCASYVKRWELIDPNVQLVVGSKVPVIKPTAPNGQVSNGLGYFYYVFLNKTIQFQDGYGVNSSDKSVVKGTWDFADSEKSTINITLNGVKQTWKIKNLTPSRFVIEIDGLTQTYAPTPGNP